MKISDLQKSLSVGPVARKGVEITTPFNEIGAEVLQYTVMERFDEVVRVHGDKIAIKTPQDIVSYKDLQRLSFKVATHIVNNHPEADGVGLHVADPVLMIAAMLGCLRAGCYYVPLDENHPAERLHSIIALSKCNAVFTDSDLNSGTMLAIARNTEMALYSISDIVLNDSDSRPGNFRNPKRCDVAYILFTSGSTGIPKGVAQTHTYIMQLWKNFTNTLHITPLDRISLIPSFSFSASAMDLYAALLNGATVYPVNFRSSNVNFIVEWFRSEAITIYHSVPNVFRFFAQAVSEKLPTLRLIYLAGEPLTKTDVELYRHRFVDNCVLVNGLGATEFNIIRQNIINKQSKIDDGPVPVGYSCPDVNVYICDDNGQDLGFNRTGEIVIKGKYIARGYWGHDSDNSAFRFEGEDVVFRTGDLGRLSFDGNLQHLGRRDFMVKIFGQRVELTEVEHIIEREGDIERAIVAYDKQLVAFVKTDSFATLAMKRKLRRFLPEYMIPAQFVCVNEFPVTTSGKIDRKKLIEGYLPKTPQSTGVNRNGTAKDFATLWAEVIGLSNDFDGELSLFDLGGNSMHIVQLVSRFSDKYGVEPDFREFFNQTFNQFHDGYLKKIVPDGANVVRT